MNNKPLVSIGVVTYNSGEFIIETLDSIKAQTYPNIELIVSDDCSSDESPDILRDCLIQFPDKVRVIRHEKNLGPGFVYI